MLAALVSQFMATMEPKVRKPVRTDLICPKCKVRPRMTYEKSGNLGDYCRECKKSNSVQYEPRRKELARAKHG